MSNIKRNSVDSICYLMENFPVVAVLGARQVGKTTLLRQLLPTSPFFDLEREADYDRIKADPEFFLSQYQNTVVLDEAQMCPELFPALRVAIDKQRKKNGQYLLSGSSSPLLTKQISETLAGRVAIFELSPFHLQESWGKTSQFYDWILKGKLNDYEQLKVHYSWEELLQSCFYGGFPDPFLHRNEENYFILWMSNYFKTYIDRDIRKLFPGLNFEAYRRFMRMLGNSSGTILKASNFSKSLDVSEPTIRSYIEIAEGTFFWRSISSFQKNPRKRFVKMPKGQVRDTGLINYLLNITNVEALLSNPLFGNIWEIFIIEQIIRGLSAKLSDFRYYYYRTHNQTEIDLILEGSFGLIPIEIKLGVKTDRRQLRVLDEFINDFRCPFGLIINNAEKPDSLSSRILQIPSGCL